MSTTKTLPAKNSKEEPNVIEITNRKLDEKLEKGTLFEIPAEQFEYTQYESLEEFVQDAGSADRALELVNAFKRDDAVTAGKNYIRTATKGTTEEVVKAGLAVTKSHSFAKSTELSAKESKDALSALRAEIGNLSEAEIADRMRKLLGV